MTYQKGGSYYEDVGSSQETEDRIELEVLKGLEAINTNSSVFLPRSCFCFSVPPISFGHSTAAHPSGRIHPP